MEAPTDHNSSIAEVATGIPIVNAHLQGIRKDLRRFEGDLAKKIKFALKNGGKECSGFIHSLL